MNNGIATPIARNPDVPMVWKIIIGIETTVLVTIFSLWMQSGQYVTKGDLQVLAPYVQDQPLIAKFMRDTTETLNLINANVAKQSDMFDKQIHKLDIDITRLQSQAFNASIYRDKK